jgi:hypothetical protein
LARIPVVVVSATAAGDLPAITCVSKNDPGALLELIERQSRTRSVPAR